VAKTLHSPCRGLGSIPGQGTISQMPQLKFPSATTKTQRNPPPQKKKFSHYIQMSINKYYQLNYVKKKKQKTKEQVKKDWKDI